MSKLARALMVGVATIFVVKPDPQMHWSIPPTVSMVCADHAEASTDEV